MALRVVSKVIGRYVLYAALVYVSGRDESARNEITEPFGGERIVLVVVGCHQNGLLPLARDVHTRQRFCARSSGCRRLMTVFSPCFSPTTLLFLRSFLALLHKYMMPFLELSNGYAQESALCEPCVTRK